MNKAEQVSLLIGDIYDAALDPSLWPAVLEQTCGFIHGACSAIVSQSPVTGAAEFYFSWGLDPHYEKLYLEKYVRLNTAAVVALSSTNVGDVTSTELLMP